MITASHNPYQDNGVKLVEPMGDMLAQDWEKWAMELANAPTPHDLVEVLEAIVKEYSIDMTAQAKVLVARDTRPSGLSLVEALKSGVAALQGDLLDEGIKTTPQCHYLVRCLNTRSEYGVPTEEGYFDKLAKAYKRIIV